MGECDKMQRIFDIFFSGLALCIFAPVLIPLVILLRFTGEGEIFYRQRRVGRFGKEFELLKFATMLKNSPNLGSGTITVENDPRVLPLGRILRKTKINELPQLVNVLIGEMSLIGPRPLTSETFSAYQVNVQKKLNTVRPGLSGIGSIIFRDEEKLLSDTDDPKIKYFEQIAPYKGELEGWYVENKNIYLYFILIFLTIYVVLRSNTQVAWWLLKGLPAKPETLNL
jgi:lipopolysaccharide/colanic/teichoic acid biosynthesis glycosyltransferase